MSAPKSWRDVIPVHPAADLFPMMSRDELLALGEDIKKNGLHTWPVLWEAEKGATVYLLDGRNRLDAMEAVGLPFLDAERTRLDLAIDSRCYRIRGVDPYATVLSFNLHRRHLTAEQRRDLITKVLKATPEKSNRQIAEQVKADGKTVGKVRRELEATAEIPQLETTTGKDGKARKQPIKKKLTANEIGLIIHEGRKIRDAEEREPGIVRRALDAMVERGEEPTKAALNRAIADKRAKTAAVSPTESTERQFAVLTDLWRMNNTLRAAWERSNLKAQRRFVRWLDGGALIDDDENEAGGGA